MSCGSNANKVKNLSCEVAPAATRARARGYHGIVVRPLDPAPRHGLQHRR